MRGAVLVVAALVLTSCGGSGSTTTPTPSASPTGPLTLTYAEDRELDLYLPPPGEDPAPVVVLLHGVAADPDLKALPAFADWADRLTARGMAVAVPNWRADVEGGPDGQADVRAVLELLDEQADDHGLDVRRRALFGFSAAGPGLVRAAYSDWAQPVSALVAFYAPLESDRPGAPTSLSTQRRRTNAPLPVLVAYGRQDTVPGVVESVPRLRRRDPTAGEVTVLVHPSGAHAFDVLQAEDPDTRRIVEHTVEWLAERLGQTV